MSCLFNSYDPYFKQPFGALRAGQTVRLTLCIPEELGYVDPHLVLQKEGKYDVPVHYRMKFDGQTPQQNHFFAVFFAFFFQSACKLFYRNRALFLDHLHLTVHKRINSSIYLSSARIHHRADQLFTAVQVISEGIHRRYCCQRNIQCKPEPFCRRRADSQPCKGAGTCRNRNQVNAL